MNNLTKFLIQELLDEQKITAVYGGGFKPPTKGHFHVAELTLEKFPEIDELKIFVGGGVRDGITQDESIKIWNIYKNYLSPKVDVEASVAPVKSILGYAKENPDTKVYWILGARDGDEGDLADIENRTKSISKYPNLEVKVITTSGGVSGTKTRQAIRDNNKEQFFHMIPDVNNTEKEEIWNMVSPIIKEDIVDNMKIKIKDFISAVKQEGQETKEVVGLLIHAAQGKIKLTDEQKEYIGNQLKDVLKIIDLTAIAVLPGGSIAAVLLKAFISKALPGVKFEKNSNFITAILPDTINELKQEPTDSMVVVLSDKGYGLNLYDTSTQQLLGYINVYNNNVTGVAAQKGYGPLMYELGMAHIYPNGLQSDRNGNTEPEAEAVLNKFIAGNSPNIKAVKLTPNDKDYKTEYPNGNKLWDVNNFFNYKFFNPNKSTLEKLILNGDKLSPEEQENIKKLGNEFYNKRVNEIVTNTEVICDNCGWEWKIADGGDDLYVCHKCGHDNNPKDNQNNAWNLQKGILYLSKYMIDNGMNIKPLPKIKMVKNDKQNASDLLGKTAFYNPNDKSITLYIMDRHPKDILRSFSHEMVHHMQNLEGRLNNIQTTNTNEDSNLPEIEREAYEKGNMILRNWEDSIKNPINEWILDIPKFNQPKTFIDKLNESLNEITLSKDNAVEINGDLMGGEFSVGNKIYEYSIKNIPNPYKDLGLFYNIQFTPQENITSTPTKDTEPKDYIKILSTMYKIIVDFIEKRKPDYIGIASLNNIGDKNYHRIYTNLTDNKYNRIPGYFRKDASLEFDSPAGKGRMVVLKRKNV
jgi:hypothetical protein